MKRPLRRAVTGTGAAVVLTAMLWSAPARAHVSIVTLGEVEAGGFATIGFNVPNERDDAGTVELEVQLPEEHPLEFVSVQPKPGWQVETTRSADDLVETIRWTALEGTRIEPGQFDQFWISVGRLPTDVESLEFPAIQTYDSGEVVRWIEPTPESGEEPENPAPVVMIAAPADGGEDDDDGDDTTLAVIALVVGGVALLLAVGGLVLGRRRVT